MSGEPEGGNARPLVARYRKVFVVAPANIVTGGPEALHQLVDAIRRNGGNAYISYYPFDAPAEIPQDYRRYDVSEAKPEDASGNLVVLPEILPLLARTFSRATIAIWWLSVDHYLGRNERPEWDELHRHVNVAQSHYAAAFLQRHGIGTMPLTDYVNDDFLAPLRRTRRRNAIAYNAKSAGEVERLKRASPELAKLTWIEIAHMSREQVRSLLSEVAIYADFGHHPGRDRMPREAALCGACVLTNRRGSANHAEDVSLPPPYKLDQQAPDFAQRLARTVRLIFATRPFHVWRQRGYRRFAAGGKATFSDEVRRAFFE
jgi:hypothetical protein